MSPELGTAVAALFASGAAVAGYFTNRASRRTAEAQTETDRSAALAISEIEGWKALIGSLTDQHKRSIDEAKDLRDRITSLEARLLDGNKRHGEAMAALSTQHAECLEREQVLAARIEKCERAIERRVTKLEAENGD